MSKDHGKNHGSKNHAKDAHHQQHNHELAKKRALHKDWRAWLIVLIMLACMIGYVATLDEATSPVKEPGGNVRMPADAPPPAAAP